MAGDSTIFRVVDVDAELERVDRRLLATVVVANIARAITDYREVRGSERLLRNGAVALGATAVFLSLLWALRRVFRWLLGRAGLRGPGGRGWWTG